MSRSLTKRLDRLEAQMVPASGFSAEQIEAMTNDEYLTALLRGDIPCPLTHEEALAELEKEP